MRKRRRKRRKRREKRGRRIKKGRMSRRMRCEHLSCFCCSVVSVQVSCRQSSDKIPEFPVYILLSWPCDLGLTPVDLIVSLYMALILGYNLISVIT